MIAYKPAIMCKLCYDMLYIKDPDSVYVNPRNNNNNSAKEAQEAHDSNNNSLCSCGNVGIILDIDKHLHIYVEDIRTTQRAIFYHNEDYKEVHRELLEPFSKAIYTNYSPITNSSHYFRPYAPRSYREAKTATKYNTELMAVLTRYKHYTSDGKEEFLKTVPNNPKKSYRTRKTYDHEKE